MHADIIWLLIMVLGIALVDKIDGLVQKKT